MEMARTCPEFRRLHFAASSLFAVLAVSCAGVGPAGNEVPGRANGAADPPDQISDPYEPANRVTWAVNRGVTLGVMDPATDLYLATVPEPVRRSIGNVRDNLNGPLRITNQILQGRWGDSGEESLRLLTNTTLGVGGLFDVADEMDLPGSKGSFNQTFRHWGWQPDTYVVLPFLGPSDNVAAPARVMDIAADPASYINGLEPVQYTTRIHQLSEIVGQAANVMRTQPDSYDLVRQAWPYLARTTPPDWTPHGAPDVASMETLAAARYKPHNPLFAKLGKRHLVRLPGTGRDFPYQVWMQRRPAPMVFLSPGTGSHRASGHTLVLAEAMHEMGFSVVAISGLFHPEFMERASTGRMPGNPVRDRADLLAAFTAIDASIAGKYRNRVTGRVLAGFSLGGFTTLQLAATEAEHPPGSVRFDHYLAIDSPVNLREAYRTLDRYYAIPATWPENERTQRLDNMFHKLAALIDQRPPAGVPPFDADESRTLVGFSFRIVLRDALYSVHDRTPSALVDAPASRWRREAVYRELMGFSYDDYLTHWLAPEVRKNGMSEKGLLQKITLRAMAGSLRRNSRIHVIGNRNDFLLTPQDVQWMNSTFGDRAQWLPNGGHLGNLGDPQFLQALGDALDTMR